MSQPQLAAKSGVAQAYIAELESGAKKNPSIDKLRKLARALGVDVTALLK